MSPTVLSNNHVTKIFHIADLHVRMGDAVRARIPEYRLVFKSFLQVLEDNTDVQEGHAILVIAGDVFHNKGRMETEGAFLFFDFISKLLDLLPVIIICGNHDFRQDDPSFTDNIEPIVAPYRNNKGKKNNIHYLRDTGLYEYGNVGFGFVSVKDTLRETAGSGLVDKLPKFPSPRGFSKNVELRSALFHGSVANDLYFGKTYPLEWFRGYDIAILGDIHRQQVNVGLDGLITWAYPGSMIQQTDGEDTFGHGFIMWDTETKKATPHHLQNPFGTITVKKDRNSDNYKVRLSKKDICDLLKVKERQWFPQTPRVRVIGDEKEKDHVLALLGAMGIYPSAVFCKSNVKLSEEDSDGGEEDRASDHASADYFADLNSTEHWIGFINEIAPSLDVKEWIENPETLLLPYDPSLPEDLQGMIKDRNKTLQKELQTYEDARAMPTGQKHRITFKYMDWDYLMCFGQGNFFDFSVNDGKIVLLNGSNAMGKSSFLDVICIAVFGCPTSNRDMIKSGQSMTSKILNDKKPDRTSARVSLVVDIDGQHYQISRTFSQEVKDRNLLRLSKFFVAKVNPGLEVIKENAQAKAWILDHFGSLEKMMMSTMLCQFDTENFFTQPTKKQLTTIDTALNMDAITCYGGILKESVNAHAYLSGKVDTFLKGLSESFYNAGAGSGASANDEVPTEDALDELRITLKKSKKAEDAAAQRSEDLLMRIGDIAMITEDDRALDAKTISKRVAKASGLLEAFADLRQEDRTSALELKGTFQEQISSLSRKLESLPIVESQGGAACRAKDLKKFEEALIAIESKKPDEPTMSIEYINKKKRDYNTWSSEQVSEWFDDPDGLAEHSVAYKEGLVDITKTHKKLLAVDVQRPASGALGASGVSDACDDTTIDFFKAPLTIKKLQKDLIKMNAKEPSAPGMSIDMINQKLKSYKTWEQAQDKEWIKDPDGLVDQVHNAVTKIDALTSQIESLRTLGITSARAGTGTGTGTRTGAPDDKTIQEFKDLQEAGKASAPPRSIAEIGSFEKEYAGWSEKVADVMSMDPVTDMEARIAEIDVYVTSITEKETELVLMKNVIADLTRDVKEMETIPHNPECWACKSNPTHVMCSSKKSQLSSVLASLRKIEKSLSKSRISEQHMADLVNERTELMSSLKPRTFYENTVGSMEAEHHACTVAKKLWDERTILDKKLKICTKELSAWLQDLEAKRTEVMVANKAKETFLANYESYNAAYTEASAQHVIWSAWTAWNNQVQGVIGNMWTLWDRAVRYGTERINVLTAELSKMDAFIEDYERNQKEYNYIVDEEKRLLKYSTWLEKRNECKDVCEALRLIIEMDRVMESQETNRALFERIAAWDEAQDAVLRWQRVQWYQEWCIQKAECLSAKAALLETSSKLARLEKTKDDYDRQIGTIKKFKRLAATMRDRCALISKLHQVFVGDKTVGADTGGAEVTGGFKAYIYKHDVIPLIEKEVNAFLSTVDSFRLSIDFIKGGFNYSLHDRGSKPTLDNCSGYQKFVVGLAMRIALSRIGAVGQNIKHLFIDEGFVACDIDNIQKVSDILSSMMESNNYKSIMLMSHLDSIRDIAETRVNIGRSEDGETSFIRFGLQKEPYKAVAGTGGKKAAASSDIKI